MNNYLLLGIVLFVYMCCWFLVSVVKKRNDVADIAWGLGFILMAWTSYFLSPEPALRSMIIVFLVSVWGLRLAWHIYSRNKHKSEDARYLAWRKDWGKWFYLRSFLQVYMLQGLLLFIIILPVLLTNLGSPQSMQWFHGIGILIWIIGFYFEVVGDAQLARFIKDPANKGKLIQTGLWAYSRHPNYFGEVTLWWGIWLLCFSPSTSWFTIIGPLTITFLILKVSGIPLLEKNMEHKPGFEEYKRRVSMFFPLPPRTSQS